MAPQNTETAPKPYACETYTPPAVPYNLPSFEVFAPKPPASEKQDSRFGPAAPGADLATMPAAEVPGSPGKNAQGGLDGARSDTFRIPTNLRPADQTRLSRDEVIQFVDFNGQTLPELRVVGKSGEYLGRDKERGDRITEINFAGDKKSALIGYASDTAMSPNRIDLTEKTPDGKKEVMIGTAGYATKAAAETAMKAAAECKPK